MRKNQEIVSVTITLGVIDVSSQDAEATVLLLALVVTKIGIRVESDLSFLFQITSKTSTLFSYIFDSFEDDQHNT